MTQLNTGCLQENLVRRTLFLSGMLIALSSFWGRAVALPPVPTAEELAQQNRDGFVNVLAFGRPGCEGCDRIMKRVVPEANNRAGGKLNMVFLDISYARNYEHMVQLEGQLGQAKREILVFFVGNTVLGGVREIEERLSSAAQQALAQGGCRLPVVRPGTTPGGGPASDGHANVDGPMTGVPPGSVLETFDGLTAPAGAKRPLIYIAYFFRPGCGACDRIDLMLRHVREERPNVRMKEFSVLRHEVVLLQEANGHRAGLPPGKRLITPAVFVGDRALLGDEIADDALATLLDAAAATGSSCPWELPEGWEKEAGDRLIREFGQIGILPVIVAGAVDGVNPCAFVTIIYFATFLAAARRRRREILAVGLCFSGAVFATYLFVGIGLLAGIEYLHFSPVVSRVFYLSVVVLTLGFAAGSFYDYAKARRGAANSMKLKLPDAVRSKIRQIIRENVRTRHFILAGIAAGILVSVLELACTGQVYLPTITYVASHPGLRARAMGLLVLYNMTFIIPLLAVLGAVVFGTASATLVRFFQKHLAATKFALGLLFLALGVLLIAGM